MNELAQIAKRIATRQALEANDRKRQRELIRELHAQGLTWDEIQARAQVSRQTVSAALKRKD